MDIKEKIKTAKNSAKVAGVFCLLISILLILNYLQMQGSEPLESSVLETLVRRLALEPGNEQLKNEIREFDLLARKAYFTSLWQVRTGGYLLLFAAIILVVSLRIYYSLIAKIAKPEEEDEDEVMGRALSRKWIMSGTGIMIAIALAAAFTVNDPLEKYVAAISDTDEESGLIERITISDASPGPSEEAASGEATVMEATGTDATGTQDSVRDMTAAESSVAAAAGAASATATFPDDNAIRRNHNAFRGPWGNGVVFHRNVPLEWDGPSGRNVLWKVPAPLHAYSSPVLWDNKLFLTGADREKRVVFCYDRNTGDLLWEAEADNIPGSPSTIPRTTDDTGLGAPSVTTDGIGVYAIFGTGDIIAFDMEGIRLWARNIGVPENHYGHSSSLLSYGEKLFVQLDDRKGGRIACLNVLSGETIWDISRTSDVSWSSPILARINNRYQLILNGNPIVAGYDTETGRELWSVEAMGGEVGSSPVFGGGMVYAANEYAKMVAIDPVSSTIVWEDNYYLPEVSSPAYSDGLLFISTTYAVVACFDAKTGEFLWEHDTDGIFYSSPIVAGGRVYVTDTDGNTYIFEVKREPGLMAKNSLGEEVFTIPAFAEGRIYFRGERNLYCIGN